METQQVTNIDMNDPFAAADNATVRAREYYGKVEFDIWFCALIKGTGKVPYDAAVHKQRATAIDILLIPIAEQNVTFEVKRQMIAESREWASIVWPSLKALGIASTRDANNRWVKLTQVSSGRKYKNSAGEEKESTTFKFLAVYADEAACQAAYLSEVKHEDMDDTAPVQATTTQPPLAAATTNNGLKVAIPFIEAFAKQAGYDLDKTKAMCKTQAIISKSIDIESPAFAEIVLNAANKAVA
jgi:hypothetical protein